MEEERLKNELQHVEVMCVCVSLKGWGVCRAGGGVVKCVEVCVCVCV